MMDLSWQPRTGAAQRRKQRRLLSWWRHEQQSIAAALATSKHHSAVRGREKARAGEWESEQNYTATIRKTPLLQPVLFSLYGGEHGGGRPASLAEPPGPQERIQRRTVDDVPVEQTVDQLVEVLSKFVDINTLSEGSRQQQQQQASIPSVPILFVCVTFSDGP